MSMLPSLVILSLVALVSLGLTRSRPVSDDLRARRKAARALAVAIVVQGGHFVEEAATGFYRRFPELLGQPAMPYSAFVIFNVAWLAIWVASVPGLRSGRPAAYFAAWFLGIAGVLNGVAHPLLALVERSYFPGVVTAPLIGIAGGFVLIRLQRATQPPVLP